jgi:hypothetical protein
MMTVFVKGSRAPLVIETNIAWAVPYWENRRKINPKLYWKFG